MIIFGYRGVCNRRCFRQPCWQNAGKKGKATKLNDRNFHKN